MRMQSAIASGLFSTQATAIAGTTNVSVTTSAAGTTQADATAISGGTTVVTTVGSGAGVVLPLSSEVGDTFEVVNAGANALLVYPPSGGAINGLSANAGYSLATNKGARFKKVTSTVWTAVGP